jgi:hypothetical protein
MSKTREYIERTETELSEWKEELGDNFPSFLNYHLAARLMKAEEHIQHLEKVRYACR